MLFPPVSRRLAATFTVLTVALIVTALPALAAEEGVPRLSLSAEGRVTAAPDMATITVGVVREAKEAGAAMTAMSQAARDVLDQMSAAGIAPEDMQTSGLSLSPRRGQPRSNERMAPIVGFIASTTVTLKARDLDALGGLLDQLVQNGANQMQGLAFGLQDPKPLRDAARRAAVIEARRKAELYAEAVGMSLGPLLLMSEAGRSAPRPTMMRAEMAMMDSAGSVPFAEGELTMTASVHVEYQLDPK